ncbi:serine protease [Nocardioides marmoriginsengisoli]|uniref:Serine protease n=1 Tax=Nocardioides marmoriginsengisoli TaxID=661483 RepID=A0A3N0CS05_9ACTN|nr:S8 family serine peptidase [Nocardioides marmoriginsengisoli]RNL66180.1 serine protease [Nocardioides marmoriginsengisoli]
MRRSHTSAAVTSAAVLLAATVAGTASTSSASPSQVRQQAATSYVVLADQGASVDQLAGRLRAAGAKVTSVNRAIGMVSVESADAGFRASAAKVSGVDGVAADRRIGYSPSRRPLGVERENLGTARQGKAARAKHAKAPKTDPFDSQLWGMKMIGADRAHRITLGSKKVRVGIMDTGVQGDHPDIHVNFDTKRSRNFVTDIPAIDGPCENASCVDPVGEDDNGHGTHVAGTIGAAMNGLGVSGVAPKVDLVEVRAGQDSGYFFLQPTVDALTYSADAGLDVVNMSFYVDPWLYNCAGGAPEDTPEQAAEQGVIIEAMNRALAYAHRKNVTLVAATGNNHEDLANPRTDISSPDYGADPHDRTIDNAKCLDLPVEGRNVIGVNALGPSGTKSDYSNYTTDLRSGEVEVSAPGGYFRDGLGTPSYRVNGNMILSTVPLVSLQDTGEVDADGNITPDGVATGVQKVCPAKPAKGTSACGYYAFYQGTSMATPHAAGVAALAVGAHGRNLGHGDFGLRPDVVRALLLGTATDHACPAGGFQSYVDVGRSAEFDATCVGTARHNGFYGHGIVNAYRVVR